MQHVARALAASESAGSFRSGDGMDRHSAFVAFLRAALAVLGAPGALVARLLEVSREVSRALDGSTRAAADTLTEADNAAAATIDGPKSAEMVRRLVDGPEASLVERLTAAAHEEAWARAPKGTLSLGLQALDLAVDAVQGRSDATTAALLAAVHRNVERDEDDPRGPEDEADARAFEAAARRARGGASRVGAFDPMKDIAARTPEELCVYVLDTHDSVATDPLDVLLAKAERSAALLYCVFDQRDSLPEDALTALYCETANATRAARELYRRKVRS